jgi:hypothetical protein
VAFHGKRGTYWIASKARTCAAPKELPCEVLEEFYAGIGQWPACERTCSHAVVVPTSR